MSKFKSKMVRVVKMIPSGNVASYGQIALFLGLPRAARAVGQSLNSLEEDIFKSTEKVPWWRVVNNLGRVSIKGTKYHNAQMQADLLRREGVNVKKDLTFDIEKYRWLPGPADLEKFELSEDAIERIMTKYF